jgi:predicted nucleic acid-binding protein
VIVVDASAILAAMFIDEAGAYSDAVLAEVEHNGGIAPFVFPAEVATALLRAERRKRLSADRTATVIDFLSRLQIRIDTDGLTHAFGRTLSLARTQDISPYDASYLELALRSALPLATEDRRLRAAATALQVPLFASS